MADQSIQNKYLFKWRSAPPQEFSSVRGSMSRNMLEGIDHSTLSCNTKKMFTKEIHTFIKELNQESVVLNMISY